MFHYKLYEHKSLYGMYYIFPNVGDGIAMHTHTEEQKHNIMVMKGSLEIYGTDKTWCRTLKVGDVMDLLDEHHPHEIYALESDTICLSLFVNGKPAGDEYLTDEDKSGTTFNKLPTLPR